MNRAKIERDVLLTLFNDAIDLLDAIAAKPAADVNDVGEVNDLLNIVEVNWPSVESLSKAVQDAITTSITPSRPAITPARPTIFMTNACSLPMPEAGEFVPKVLQIGSSNRLSSPNHHRGLIHDEPSGSQYFPSADSTATSTSGASSGQVLKSSTGTKT